MSHAISFKVIKRLEEKHHERRSAACPKKVNVLSALIDNHCRHYGHPQMKGEETCYCGSTKPVSE